MDIIDRDFIAQYPSDEYIIVCHPSRKEELDEYEFPYKIMTSEYIDDLDNMYFVPIDKESKITIEVETR